MSSDKNCHYKLDFKYSFENESSTYTLTGSRTWSNIRFGGVCKVIYNRYKIHEKIDDLYKLIDDSTLKPKTAIYVAKLKTIGYKEFANYIKYTDDQPFADNRYNIMDSINYVLPHAIMKTPEYAHVEAQFQKWIKRRPGIAKAWDQYNNYRITTKRSFYNYDEGAHEDAKIMELNSQNFSESFREGHFRSILENARPLKYEQGQVVKLKQEYRGKRGKDPFYYESKEIAKNPRVGVVTEQKFDANSYGVGSRYINIMWFATGAESTVMERCLSLAVEGQDY